MKKAFLLLTIITFKTLFTTSLLHATCNQSTAPNVFKIHGTEKERAVIEGECLNELLKAMGEGKDIDIEHAEIRGDIDFTNPKFFPEQTLNQVEEDLDFDAFFSHIDRIRIAKHPSEIKIILVRSNINITNSTIVGNIIAFLSKSKMDEKINILVFKEKVNFSKTKFDGEINFQFSLFVENADFSESEVSGITDFTVATFVRNAHFVSSRFYGEAKLFNIQFNKEANFIDVRFAKKAYFMNARFKGDANIYITIFSGDVLFDKTQFDGYANFWKAQFAKRAVFKSTIFAENAYFNSAIFGKESTYTKENVKCEKLMEIIANETNVDIEDIKSQKTKITEEDGKYFIDFQGKHIGKKQLSLRLINLLRVHQAVVDEEKPEQTSKSVEDILQEKKIVAYKKTACDFSDATFTKFANFRNALFLCDIDFREAKFTEVGLFDGCFFFNAKELGLVEENTEGSIVNLSMDKAYFNLLKGVSFNHVFYNLNKRVKFKTANKEEMQSIIDNYIYLQENFRKIGRFEDADSIYLERKRIEAANLTGWRNWWKMMWNWILEVTCNYGTNFTHIFISCGSLIAIFTTIYFLTVIPVFQKHLGNVIIYDEKNDKITWPKRLWLSFYVSMNSFTTLGTGDIIVTRYFRPFVIIEGILGWFMLGLFIVVFAAQYMR